MVTSPERKVQRNPSRMTLTGSHETDVGPSPGPDPTLCSEYGALIVQAWVMLSPQGSGGKSAPVIQQATSGGRGNSTEESRLFPPKGRETGPDVSCPSVTPEGTFACLPSEHPDGVHSLKPSSCINRIWEDLTSHCLNEHEMKPHMGQEELQECLIAQPPAW